jgi:hypothetical protein
VAIKDQERVSLGQNGVGNGIVFWGEEKRRRKERRRRVR